MLSRVLYTAFCMLVCLAIVVVVGLTTLRAQGKSLLNVQTASMEPVFRPGDSIVVEPVKFNELNSGDIISYRSPHNKKIVVTHRIVSISPQYHSITTKGDNLTGPDPIVHEQQIVGRASLLLPNLGGTISALLSPVGIVVFIYMPALITIIYEVWYLLNWSRRPAYRILELR